MAQGCLVPDAEGIQAEMQSAIGRGFQKRQQNGVTETEPTYGTHDRLGGSYLFRDYAKVRRLGRLWRMDLASSVDIDAHVVRSRAFCAATSRSR